MLKQTFILLYASCLVLGGLTDIKITYTLPLSIPQIEISKHQNTETTADEIAELAVPAQGNKGSFIKTGLMDRNIKNPIFDVFKSILPDFQISKHDNTEAIVENPAEPGVLDQDNEEGIPKDIISHLKHLHEIGIPNIHSLKDHIHHGHVHGAEEPTDLPEDCPIDPVDVLCPEILPDCIEAIEDFLHCPEDEDIPVDEECLPIDPIHDCLDNDEDDADEDGTEEGDGEEDCPKDGDAEEDDDEEDNAEEDGSEKEEPESDGTEVDSNVP